MAGPRPGRRLPPAPGHIPPISSSHHLLVGFPGRSAGQKYHWASIPNPLTVPLLAGVTFRVMLLYWNWTFALSFMYQFKTIECSSSWPPLILLLFRSTYEYR